MECDTEIKRAGQVCSDSIKSVNILTEERIKNFKGKSEVEYSALKRQREEVSILEGTPGTQEFSYKRKANSEFWSFCSHVDDALKRKHSLEGALKIKEQEECGM